MIFIFSRIALLLIIPLIGNVCLLSMESDYLLEGDELSCATKMLQALYITPRPATQISTRHQLFSQRLIKHLDAKNIIDTSSDLEIDTFRQNFFNTVYALRHGDYSNREMTYVTRELVAELCKKSLNIFIEKYDGNTEIKEALQKILTQLNDDSNAIVDTSLLNRITLECREAYRQLSCIEEKKYMKVLNSISQKCRFGDSMAKALFIEALKTCDTIFAERDQSDIDSLSMTDLKELFNTMCGHHTHDISKIFMALSGSEELTGTTVWFKALYLYIVAAAIFGISFFIGTMIFVDPRDYLSPKGVWPLQITSICISIGVCIAIMGWNSWVYCRTKKI